MSRKRSCAEAMTNGSNEIVVKNVEDLEEVVDTRVAEAVQNFMIRLQNERHRIVEAGSRALGNAYCENAKVVFSLDDKFNETMHHFLNMPFGNIYVGEIDHRSKLSNSRATNEDSKKMKARARESSDDTDFVQFLPSAETPLPTPSVDIPLSTNVSSKKTQGYTYVADFYKKMQVTKVVKCKDMLGIRIEQPHAIIQLPGTELLAFIHTENRISLLGADGNIMATFEMLLNHRRGRFLFRPWEKNSLCADSDEKQVFFLDTFSRIMKFKPSEAASVAEGIVPSVCKALGGSARQLSGLAYSVKTKLFFIAHNSEILALSADNWNIRSSSKMKNNGVPTICALSEHVDYNSDGCSSNPSSPSSFLYFKLEDGRELYRINYTNNGKFRGAPVKFAGGFKKIRGVAFDPAGNVLVVDNGRRRIEVFSQDGTSLATIYPDSLVKDSFYPSGIAFLDTESENSDHASNRPPIVAVTDYFADCIFFFSVK